MNRTTKAMARLGTLAVTAGTVLAMPFAAGTAFAAAATTSSVNGVQTSGANAAAGNGGTSPGSVSITGVTAASVTTLTLSGSAFWTSTPAQPAGAVVTTVGHTRDTLTYTAGATSNTFKVGDAVAQAVTATITSGTDTFTPNPVNLTFAPAGVMTAPAIKHGAATTVTNSTTATPNNGFAAGPRPALLTVGAGGLDGDQIKLTISGSGYFDGTGDLRILTSKTAQCTAGAAGTCATGGAFKIGDASPDSVTVTISDLTNPSLSPTDAATVLFNGIYFTTCGGTPTPPDTQSLLGGGAVCVSQAKYGDPVTETVKYIAGGVSSLQNNVALLASIPTVYDGQFSATQNPNVQVVAGTNSHQATCNTDSGGGCSFNVQDSNQSDTAFVLIVTTNAMPLAPAGNSWNTAGDAPACGDIVHEFFVAGFGPYPAGCSTDGATNAPLEIIALSNNSVTPSRLNLITTKIIAPTTQTAPKSPFAEPGDVVQLTYRLLGACTPSTGNVNCDNTSGATAANLAVPLAGITQTLKIDHGGFTPNCVTPQTTQGGVGFPKPPASAPAYADCTFNTAPVNGAKVGDLKITGDTMDVKTDEGGYFTVSVAIGKDSAFDASGIVVAHLTDGTLAPLEPGALTTGAGACPSGGQAVQAGVTANQVIVAGAGPAVPVRAGCQEDIAWTTQEQPLNGGSAKLAAIAPLSSPNNVSIPTENNFNASDSGTVNVPDQSRVVFVVHATDQFGNLTSDAGDAGMSMVKTGPGSVWVCGLGTGTGINACPAPPALVPSGAPVSQPDGTFKQTNNAVVASYQNLPAQFRYQADTAPLPGGPANNGFGTTTPSVNNGTTTIVLTWTPPTTTFTAVTAGTSTTPTTANYVAGTGPAVTDTFTLNFYNQNTQPVVTFNVKPSNSVQTATAVTVTATVVDQFGNPLVLPGAAAGGVQFIRSGGNESSCRPIQDNQQATIYPTNTSGVAGFTFSCDSPGVSTVAVVVTGPGGIQLATGQEAIKFTGPPLAGGSTKKEKPGFSITSPNKHTLVLHAFTRPTLKGVTIHFYRVVHGVKRLVGASKTGAAGHAHLTIKHLKSGKRYSYAAKAVHLSTKYHSVLSKVHSHKVK